MQDAGVADDLVVRPGGVDVVNQSLHVHRVAGVAVDGRRVMAGDAIFDVGARAAVEIEHVVAGVAGVVVDDEARKRRCAAGRHEVEDAVAGDRRLVADLDAETMRLVRIEHGGADVGGQRIRKRVLVGAVVVVHQPRCGRGFSRTLPGRAAGAGDVVLPLAGCAAARRRRRELSEHETRGGGRQPDQPLVQVVGQAEGDDRRTAARGHGDAVDRDIDGLGAPDRETAAAAGRPRRAGRAAGSRRARGSLDARRAIVAAPGHERAEREQKNQTQCKFGVHCRFILRIDEWPAASVGSPRQDAVFGPLTQSYSGPIRGRGTYVSSAIACENRPARLWNRIGRESS